MNRWLIVGTACLSGCAFNLGNVQPQAGKTADQQQLATLECEHEAQLAASDGAHVAAGILLGITIIGIPVAIAMDHSVQRSTFSSCMAGKGFLVTPA